VLNFVSVQLGSTTCGTDVIDGGVSLSGAAHALAATAPNAERCCRTKFRNVSGARPQAAVGAAGSVSFRKIVVLFSHIFPLVVINRACVFGQIAVKPPSTATVAPVR
jgi:hypothetical protein